MSLPSNQSNERFRARTFGLHLGTLPTGHWNAITDVAGVLVGQTTVVFGDSSLRPGHGPARTGVTVIRPHPGNVFLEKVPGAIEVINGFGKTTGLVQVAELGTIETPIALTSTLCVGRVADALVTHAIQETPTIGTSTSTVNPIVGECSDAYLNDIQGRHVTEAHVLDAITQASTGPVQEGCVGAGMGMSAFGYKGGIGTSSRVIPEEIGGWTVGVLVLANFGTRPQLRIDGVPVGQILEEQDRSSVSAPERGSVMIVIATDAPLLDRPLRRLGRRAGFGLARTGSIASHHSGDVAIAFSTAMNVRIPHHPTDLIQSIEIVNENAPNGSARTMDALFTATIEATEEAVLNALFQATTVVGRDNHRRDALPLDRVHEILRQAGRLA